MHYNCIGPLQYLGTVHLRGAVCSLEELEHLLHDGKSINIPPAKHSAEKQQWLAGEVNCHHKQSVRGLSQQGGHGTFAVSVQAAWRGGAHLPIEYAVLRRESLMCCMNVQPALCANEDLVTVHERSDTSSPATKCEQKVSEK